jgi:hypothetical protein
MNKYPWVRCAHCGARVPPDALTCKQCGAPPPLTPGECEVIESLSFGEWIGIYDSITAGFYREPPGPLPLGGLKGFIVRRTMEKSDLPPGARGRCLYYHLPRDGILNHLTVTCSEPGLLCRVMLTVNGMIRLVDLEIVLPLSLHLDLDTIATADAEIQVEALTASQAPCTFYFLRRVLVRDCAR